MAQMKDIQVGLIGFGTVGAGVAAGLQKNGDTLAARLGVRPVLTRIADLDTTTDRGVKIPRGVLTTDAMSVLRDPDIGIVIELVGGMGVARTFVTEALRQGKTVVTANKALLAEHGREIFALAARSGVDLYFGASVGGGMPIIRSLRDGLIANRINGFCGILNGTCNYILNRMEEAGLTFDAALKEAQRAGYAEADPTLDIDGIDTAHKAVLLARLAYGLHVPMGAIHIQGIRGLAAEDIANARQLGYRIKLLAIARRDGHEFEVRVHPVLVPLRSMLASVSGVFNAVLVQGDLVGDSLYYGRGAGREPTASTVIADVADAARNLAAGTVRGWPAESAEKLRLRPMGAVETRYYLRVSLLDKPGALARVATVLGRHHISIASALQRETHRGKHVPVVIVTQRAREAEVRKALRQVDALDMAGAPTVGIRIQD